MQADLNLTDDEDNKERREKRFTAVRVMMEKFCYPTRMIKELKESLSTERRPEYKKQCLTPSAGVERPSL